MANHSGPESCGMFREGPIEALTGETGRPAIEPRNQESGVPTLLCEAEGHMVHSDNRKLCADPTRSETLSMPGSFSHESSEISAVSGAVGKPDRARKGNRNLAINAAEKSDAPIVPKKPSNNGYTPAERVEERGAAKGNADLSPAYRTQSRVSASKRWESIREMAKRNRNCRFTALLHHVTPALLIKSFYSLRQQAAAGVDGVTWQDYENVLLKRIPDLHREIHTGAYRAQASRRVYIPKADGRQRPLGIAALEDKIVQQAIVQVLNTIYEQDFLGFSYGFRPGRSQHDALDALSEGICGRKVNWILDADIRSFFDEIDHEWMMRFLEHRIADKRLLRLIRNWLQAGVLEDGRRIAAVRGTPQGAVISPLLANIYLHYALDLWSHQWRKKHALGNVIMVRYADDSVMGFQYEGDAKCFLAAMRERLGRFKLELHPDKTRLIRFGRYASQQCEERDDKKPATFDFLGFTHCCGRGRKGGFMIVRVTVKKRMRATLKEIRTVLMRRRHEPLPKIGRWLGSVVRGYLNYYAVPGNMMRLSGFMSEVCRSWRHALIRRSQRHQMNWSRFNRLVRKYLPPCRVVHPFPAARFHVKT